MSMALTLTLPEADELRVMEMARVRGLSIDEYVSELISQRVSETKNFAEIAAPFAASFAASGCTEEELDAIVEKARQEIWDEQQARAASR